MELNTNINVKKIEHQLDKTDKSINSSVSKLSTGSQQSGNIKNLASIGKSAKTLSEINSLEKIYTNISVGTDLLKIANKSLDDIKNILFRSKELTVQAASDSYSSSDRSAMNGELTQLLSQIDTIVSTTQYNDQKLLDGTFTDKKFTTNLNTIDADKLNVSIESASVSELFNYTPPSFANGDFSNGTENWTVVELSLIHI